MEGEGTVVERVGCYCGGGRVLLWKGCDVVEEEGYCCGRDVMMWRGRVLLWK